MPLVDFYQQYKSIIYITDKFKNGELLHQTRFNALSEVNFVVFSILSCVTFVIF